MIISLKFIKKYDTWKMLVKGLYFFEVSLVFQMVKNSPANVREAKDMGLIPESEKYLGVGNDNLL